MKEMISKIKKNIIKIYNSFNYDISVKKIAVVILTIFLFFAFNDRIKSFIESFLFIEQGFSNFGLDLLIISTSIASIFFIIFRYRKYKYLSSFTEVYFSFVLSISILFFLRKANEFSWTFYKDQILYLRYVWYLIIPLLSIIVLFLLKIISRHFWVPFKNKKTTDNEFKSDDPVFRLDDDKLGYSPIVKRLSRILLKEKHNKSLSIGLIGPWGNGKSSVINLLKKNIEDKQYLKSSNVNSSPIVIHFLPYLNHKEDDIINEFFIALSDKLSKYNGKLSNQIISYSQKLTDLYKNKNVLGLLENHVTNVSDKPAKALYDDIDKRLKEIDKKIIVFVDDLDRLNDKEILQVLKLIRNTANFYNTIFVVAMDKQYVLGRLTSSNNILNSNFVDKFFQLEVFLPEIDQIILRNYVFDVLINSLKDFEPLFESKLTLAFNDNKNLFEDYVKNFRDAKRVINQIIYDYRNFGVEIDLKDFMNFTFFKLKFPKVLKLLNDNRYEYLESEAEKGIYKLIELKPEEIKELKNNEKITNTLKRSRKNNDSLRLIIYDIHKKVHDKTSFFSEKINLAYEDRNLLIKTLAHLFGNENEDSNYNSIKKVNNFRMLMQQRLFENTMTEREFNNIIDLSNSNHLIDNLNRLSDENKIEQLINRFEYFSTQNEDLLDNTIIIVLQLFDKNKELKINEASILKILSDFIHSKKLLNKEKTPRFINWIIKHVFESDTISTINRIQILSELWKSKFENNNWELKDTQIAELAKLLFSDYLLSKNMLWKVDNWDFYTVFHSLKKIPTVKEFLIKKFKEFWSTKSIELLVAQNLDFDSFSVSGYNLSDFALEVFETKTAYYQYVKNHKDKNKPEVKEIIDFLELCYITKFEKYLKFNFKDSKLVIQRITNHKKQFGDKPVDDDYINLVQVFFVMNNSESYFKLRKNRDLFKDNKTEFYTEYIDDPEDDKNTLDLYYFVVNFEAKNYEKEIVSFSKAFANTLAIDDNDNFIESKVLKKENFILFTDDSEFIKIKAIN